MKKFKCGNGQKNRRSRNILQIIKFTFFFPETYTATKRVFLISINYAQLKNAVEH